MSSFSASRSSMTNNCFIFENVGARDSSGAYILLSIRSCLLVFAQRLYVTFINDKEKESQAQLASDKRLVLIGVYRRGVSKLCHLSGRLSWGY